MGIYYPITHLVCKFVSGCISHILILAVAAEVAAAAAARIVSSTDGQHRRQCGEFPIWKFPADCFIILRHPVVVRCCCSCLFLRRSLLGSLLPVLGSTILEPHLQGYGTNIS